MRADDPTYRHGPGGDFEPRRICTTHQRCLSERRYRQNVLDVDGMLGVHGRWGSPDGVGLVLHVPRDSSATRPTQTRSPTRPCFPTRYRNSRGWDQQSEITMRPHTEGSTLPNGLRQMRSPKFFTRAHKTTSAGVMRYLRYRLALTAMPAE